MTHPALERRPFVGFSNLGRWLQVTGITHFLLRPSLSADSLVSRHHLGSRSELGGRAR